MLEWNANRNISGATFPHALRRYVGVGSGSQLDFMITELVVLTESVLILVFFINVGTFCQSQVVLTLPTKWSPDNSALGESSIKGVIFGA